MLLYFSAANRERPTGAQLQGASAASLFASRHPSASLCLASASARQGTALGPCFHRPTLLPATRTNSKERRPPGTDDGGESSTARNAFGTKHPCLGTARERQRDKRTAIRDTQPDLLFVLFACVGCSSLCLLRVARGSGPLANADPRCSLGETRSEGSEERGQVCSACFET